MCGIGGILRCDGEPIPEEWLDRIDARIAWRGPDGCGRFRDRVEIEDAAAPGGKRVVEVAFVHRRLSIIDHAGGHQPMVSETGRNESEGLVAVVFNGCIYNHRELRTELEKEGHRFVTDHSDTEVLIHGWRQWREQLSQHLEGMYAFAIWDRRQFRVHMSRDVYGEKPLYVRETCTTNEADIVGSPVIAFGSEPFSLTLLPAPRVVVGDWCRRDWLLNYLLLGYAEIAHGPHHVDVHADQQSVTYCSRGGLWHASSVDRREVEAGKPKPDFELLLRRAVDQRLEADVSLGCFLSGGVDSSLITYFASRSHPGLRTFSVRMPDPSYDESDIAERVAKHVGTTHETLECESNAADDLQGLIRMMGQPFGDSSLLPTHWIARAARRYVKVALVGDGGDELFIGYDRYRAARLLARHYRTLGRLSFALVNGASPRTLLGRIGRLSDMANCYPAIGLVAAEAIFTPDQIESLTPQFSDPSWDCSVHDHEPLDECLRSCFPDSEDPLVRLREWDVSHYLPFDLLRKVDTASMAAGLEVRCPFLDRALAAAALAAPIDQLMPRGQRKGLLRQIARKYLPREIVDRPKMGFAIPIGEWFRTDFGGMKTLLLDHLNSAEPFGPISLNRKAVQRFIDEHMSKKRDHSQRLFTLLTLSIWARSLS